MVRNNFIIGKRKTKELAEKLERDYIRSRVRKPYMTGIIKVGSNYIVKVTKNKK